MKIKIIIGLVLTFIYLNSINILATTYYYEWENTIINIPVFSSLEKYQDIPRAHLFVDGVEVDCDLKYNIEGDWLYYLSNVNTSKVGEYKVWYKVYENRLYKPGTCKGYKVLVTFNVIDNEKPQVECYKEIVEVYRGNTYSLENNVFVSDNYDKNVSLNFIHNIDFNKNGEYIVDVVAVDSFGNKNTTNFIVRVYSEEPYILSHIDGTFIPISLNGNIDLSQYFTAYDYVDGNISNKLIFPVIDTTYVSNELKRYVVELNYNGFYVCKEFYVKVTDDVEAVITLTTENIILDYKTNIELFDFSSYILSIEDNNPIDYNNLYIEHNLENNVGQYIVKYIYFDGSYTTSKNINVKFISYVLPVVEITDVYINVGDYINLEDYVYVYDESDPLILNSLNINSESVDFNTPGTYYAEVYVLNSSGESVIKKIRITINDNENNIVYTEIIYIVCIAVLIIILVIILIKRKKKEKVST